MNPQEEEGIDTMKKMSMISLSSSRRPRNKLLTIPRRHILWQNETLPSRHNPICYCEEGHRQDKRTSVVHIVRSDRKNCRLGFSPHAPQIAIDSESMSLASWTKHSSLLNASKPALPRHFRRQGHRRLEPFEHSLRGQHVLDVVFGVVLVLLLGRNKDGRRRVRDFGTHGGRGAYAHMT